MVSREQCTLHAIATYELQSAIEGQPTRCTHRHGNIVMRANKGTQRAQQSEGVNSTQQVAGCSGMRKHIVCRIVCGASVQVVNRLHRVHCSLRECRCAVRCRCADSCGTVRTPDTHAAMECAVESALLRAVHWHSETCAATCHCAASVVCYACSRIHDYGALHRPSTPTPSPPTCRAASITYPRTAVHMCTVLGGVQHGCVRHIHLLRAMEHQTVCCVNAP